ncbi:MAG: di-trans,poly-cis-decaprenylcistransferase, partial [Deltaproteobacteria bacterium]|nr:di-trans,poly-cis-decaprenylcistransferase [Deltaproteobacteria bacterium]
MQGDFIKIPQHVALIPDGNRRFAKRLMKEPWKGHEWGTEKFQKAFSWCRELGIKHMTFYTLSIENLNSRPKTELDFLMRIAGKELDTMIDGTSFVHKHRVKVNFIGRTDLLNKEIQEKIEKAREATKKYNDYTITLAIAYGGRQEITNAAKRIGLKVASGKLSPEKINEETMRQNLWTNGSGDPDLIIRTGGEKRLSNFLLFQGAYSELAFVDTLWPEFSKEEFV